MPRAFRPFLITLFNIDYGPFILCRSFDFLFSVLGDLGQDRERVVTFRGVGDHLLGPGQPGT